MNDVLQKEIDRCEDMRTLISSRCESDFLVPRTLCTLQNTEIEELSEILGNYSKIMTILKENVQSDNRL